MASAAIGLQQRLAQFQQQQQMARQQQHKQQGGQPQHLPPVTLPGSQPFPPYMYRQQQEPAAPSSSQPPPSRDPGLSAPAVAYSSGQPGHQMAGAGSPRVPKPGLVSWGDAQMGAPGQPGTNPVSAGALQQVHSQFPKARGPVYLATRLSYQLACCKASIPLPFLAL